MNKSRKAKSGKCYILHKNVLKFFAKTIIFCKKVAFIKNMMYNKR